MVYARFRGAIEAALERAKRRRTEVGIGFGPCQDEATMWTSALVASLTATPGVDVIERWFVPAVDTSSVTAGREWAQVAAEALHTEGVSEQAISTQGELGAAIDRERLESLLTEEEGSLDAIARMVDTDGLLRVTVSGTDAGVLVAVAALDLTGPAVIGRSSVTVPRARIADGIRAAVGRLFGRSVSVEPVPGGDPSLNDALRALVRSVGERWRAMDPSGLDRLAFSPFRGKGPSFAGETMVANFESLLTSRLESSEGVPLAPPPNELPEGMTLIEPLSPDKRASLARFLGGTALLTGEVSDFGDHALLTVRLYDGTTGERLLLQHAAARRQVTVDALVAAGLVRRTPGDAIYRSVLLPGWGQFYNGQPIKGGIMATLAAGAAATAVVAFVVADERGREAERFDNLEPIGVECFTREECAAISEQLRGEQDDWQISGVAALGVYGVNLLWSAIDAGLSARRGRRPHRKGSPWTVAPTPTSSGWRVGLRGRW